MSSSNRLFVGAVVSAVVVAAGVGLLLAGSPGEARRRRLDDRRIEDLLGLSFAVEHYARQQGRLPRSLGELARSPAPVDSTDPTTRRVYGYRAIDSTHYELCATFERSSSDDSADGGRWSRDRDWAHGAGRQCFRREFRDRPQPQ